MPHGRPRRKWLHSLISRAARAVLEKQEIARRFGLAYRDLRALDSVLRNMPSILARPRAIIANLEVH